MQTQKDKLNIIHDTHKHKVDILLKQTMYT